MRAHAIFIRIVTSAAPVTLEHLAEAEGIARNAAVQALRAVIARGWATRTGPGRYEATAAGRAAHAAGRRVGKGPWRPRTGLQQPARTTARQRAWKTLRALGKGSLRDLRIMGGAEGTANNLRLYLRVLVRAGYVAAIPPLRPGARGSHVRYVLVRDTGPLAPVWQPSRRRLVDRNIGAAVELPQ